MSLLENILWALRSIQIPKGEHLNYILGSAEYAADEGIESYFIARAMAEVAVKFAEDSPNYKATFDPTLFFDKIAEIRGIGASFRDNELINLDYNGEKISLERSHGGLMNLDVFWYFRHGATPIQGDENAEVALKYYTQLNYLDTFQVRSTDMNWFNSLQESANKIEGYFEQFDKEDPSRFFETFLWEDADKLVDFDPKNQRFLSRARFNERVTSSAQDYYLFMFDAVGLNVFNRIEMESAAIQIYALMNSGNAKEAYRILSNVLRNVDFMMESYNSALRNKFIHRLGINDFELLGALGGDETIFAIDKKYFESIGLDTPEQVADFVDEIKAEIFNEYSVQMRSAQVLYEKSHQDINLRGMEEYDGKARFTYVKSLFQQLFDQDYVRALSKLDNLIDEAKKSEKLNRVSLKTQFGDIDYNMQVDEKSETLRQIEKIRAYGELRNMVMHDATLENVSDIEQLIETLAATKAIPLQDEYKVSRLVWSGTKDGLESVSRRTANAKHKEHTVNEVIEGVYTFVYQAIHRHNTTQNVPGRYDVTEKRSGNLTIVQKN